MTRGLEVPVNLTTIVELSAMSNPIYPTNQNCTKCLENKNFEEFYNLKGGKNGKHSWCKECVLKSRASRYQMPEVKSKIQEYRKEYIKIPSNKQKVYETYLRNRYNITITQYNQMFSNQNGCCGFCNTHQSELKTRLAVDHCHKTGKVRRLLCDPCNMAFGLVKESKETLQRMIDSIN